MTAAFELIRDFWLWFVVALVSVLVFVQSPGSYNSTSHSILHGLCAQTPSHTFTFGGQPLPFDARMTGIYGGLLITIVNLGLRRRFFCSGEISRRVMGALAFLIGAMAFDGFNSLLTDIGAGQLYEPHNLARLVTGFGAGMALAVALCWLVSASAWRMSRPVPCVASPYELSTPLAGLMLLCAAIQFGPAWLLMPLTALLVTSAWLTLTMLMLVIVLLVLRIDVQIGSVRSLHVPVAIAAVLGICVMLVLAGARFWLERTLGISNAMM